MTRGTAARSGLTGDVGGKTGTAEDLTDAWFSGYRGDTTVAVWVGYPDHRPMRIPTSSRDGMGSSYPLSIFVKATAD